jgi:3-polyprenyl-4-hydroxybenzoate decarboxylase
MTGEHAPRTQHRAVRTRLTASALCLSLALAVASCGKKGPPLVPYIRIPGPVEPVTAKRSGDDVYVAITVPAKNVDASLQQALLVAAGARAGAYGGKFVIVVDDDIDITNPADVIWAIATRCHVREGLDVVKGVWASVCEPALPPEERSPRGYTSDRVLIDACRPYKWMDQFPAVNAFSKEVKDTIAEKWKI